MVTAYGIFSGGLDSLLASRLLLDQGLDVRLITFVTPFFSDRRAQDSSRLIGLATRPKDITRLHLEMLKSPKHGFGRFMNPCIDCHALMFNQAGQIMTAEGGDFLFSGEVLGQRPMSQNIQALGVVARESGFPDRILRPLSALRLAPTPVEEAGLVDRQRLLGFSGRSRKPQMALAASYGLTGYPSPAGGCLLTDPIFSRRLRDLFNRHPDHRIRDIELLKVGRHFRLTDTTKAVVGRNANDNGTIERLAEACDALIRVDQFPGPTVLVPGGGDEGTRRLAAGLCARYSDAPRNREAAVHCLRDGIMTPLTVLAVTPEEAERLLI